MPNDSTRRNITETSEWTPGIYQLEENDVAEAGPDGILNQPIKDLAARTNYLKKLITELQPTVPGTEKYDELLEKINALDAASEDYRINHLERLVGNLYIQIQSANIDPDGYDNAIFETFDNNGQEIDQTVAEVTSVVSGDDSVDVKESENLLIGAHYQLTDGEKMEEVQIKSINVSGGIHRVKLMADVKNQYTDGRAKLYRSSIAITGGKAYGGGNTSTQSIDTDETFAGADTVQELSTTIDYSDAGAFTLKNAHVEDGKIVMGSAAVGIALVTPDGTANGTNWINVDGEGDKLTQAALS